jgi:hypothetical protein
MSIVGRLVSISLGVLFAGLSSPTWAGAYDDAMEAANHFIDSYEEIRQMDVEQLTRFVEAVCHADMDERESVANEERSRVEGMIKDQKQRLDGEKAAADSKISTAMSDPQTEDEQKDKLERIQDRMIEVAKRIQNIEDNGVRAGSNPAFDKLRKFGQMAHDDYNLFHSECAEFRDIPVGNLKPDCILPAESCIVIELKPENDRDIANGWKNAEDSRDLLNTSKGFDALSDDYKTKLAGCMGKFTARVDCYHYCPHINDDGTITDGNGDWVVCKTS